MCRRFFSKSKHWSRVSHLEQKIADSLLIRLLEYLAKSYLVSSSHRFTAENSLVLMPLDECYDRSASKRCTCGGYNIFVETGQPTSNLVRAVCLRDPRGYISRGHSPLFEYLGSQHHLPPRHSPSS